MKSFKLYFLFLILFPFKSTYCQNTKISTLQAKQICYTCTRDNCNLETVNFLVSIDWSKGELVFHRNITEKYYINKIITKKEEEDGTNTLFLCTNLDNLKEYYILQTVLKSMDKITFLIQLKEDLKCQTMIICGYL